MLKLGKTQTLLVHSKDSSGYYLLCDDKDEVFLPGSLVDKPVKKGDLVEVFIFTNKKGEQSATTKIPYAQLDDFACLEVVEITEFGAYLDMGLPKDLFIPNVFIKYPMEIGELHLVKIILDESDLLIATEEIEEYIEREFIPLKKKQNVNIVPYHKTPLGYKVLIDNQYLGMIYHNQLFTKVEIGKTYEGFVKEVREDGQIDVLFHKMGLAGLEENAEKIFQVLEKNDGILKLNDKSSPDEIRSKLEMSKKSFKSAIGILYKKKLILIEDDHIRINAE